VKGWEKLEVVAKSSSPDNLVMNAQDDEINVNCRGNCSIRVPYGVVFQDCHITGDATFKSLERELTISKLSGNLSLRSVGNANLGSVQGNISARNIDGKITIEKCQGNVSVRDIQGDLMIAESIAGNLTLKEIDGSAKAHARGNISVELDPSPESSYDFQAKGNLACRVPADASVAVKILHGSKISVKIPGVEVPPIIDAPFDLVLGEGDANLTLDAPGNISLASRPPDWDMGEFEVEMSEDFDLMADALNEQISTRIEAQMEMMEEELEHQLDTLSFSLEKTALSAEQAERIAERAREASERANRRAQEKIRRSQEKMQRKLEAAQRRAERKARAAERAARDRRRRSEPPKRPIRQKTEPVFDEERMMILQMLEQGKVTPEEAEQLLAALEGKSA
jgi:flagellar biosynthesis GTPase FlhF